MTLQIMLAGGAIKRYHTKRVLHEQTVAEHSWRMIAILRHLQPQASANLVMAVALHDVSEIVTGDIPSPVKWGNPELRQQLNAITTAFENERNLRPQLTPVEAQMVRWLDYCEGSMFCIDELTMGNLFMLNTAERYLSSLRSLERHPNTDVCERQSHTIWNLAEKYNSFQKGD